MPLDSGLVHRFTMLERAARTMAVSGRLDEAARLFEEMLAIAPEDTGLSKLKARFAADLIKQAVQKQKREAGTGILELVNGKIPPSHLGDHERDALAKAKEDLFSL